MPAPPSNTHSDAREKDALVGKILGNYRLLERIGIGATALVYRAEHVQLGRIYAVKILHPSISIRAGMRERFLREAKTAGQLNHENIIFIADFAIDPQLGPYMVMEFLEGENLQDLVERQGNLSLEQVDEITDQVCQALYVAHSAGIIHRDLKPENIFLLRRSDGGLTVKILDFGIARLVQSTASLTGEGKLLGTPLYMSPEQCRGNTELTLASDIYSFGVVLFEMLTGRTPFEGDNPQKLLIDHFLVDPPELPTHFSDSLRALQAELLAKTPEERPLDMEIVRQRLREAIADSKNHFRVDLQISDAAFTHEQLPALTPERAEALADHRSDVSELSASDLFYDLPTSPGQLQPRSQTTPSAAFTSEMPQLGPDGRQFQESPTQDQLPATGHSYTPPPASMVKGHQGDDLVRQSPTWDHESAQVGTIGIGPGIDVSLTDPRRMTLQGTSLTTNDVIKAATAGPPPVVVKQRNTPHPHDNQDPLLDDLEHLFSGSQQELSSPEAHLHRNDEQPPVSVDEELLRDLDQGLLPEQANKGWTEAYHSSVNTWQGDEPLIELRQKKQVGSPYDASTIRVEKGGAPLQPAHKERTSPSPPPPPDRASPFASSTVRVEKGGAPPQPAEKERTNPSPPPPEGSTPPRSLAGPSPSVIVEMGHNAKSQARKLKDTGMDRTEIDLSLADAMQMSGLQGENLDLEEMLNLSIQREKESLPPPPPSHSGASTPAVPESELHEPMTLQEGVTQTPLAAASTSPSRAPTFQQRDLSSQVGQSIFNPPSSPSRGFPVGLVLALVGLALAVGGMVYWFWLR